MLTCPTKRAELRQVHAITERMASLLVSMETKWVGVGHEGSQKNW